MSKKTAAKSEARKIAPAAPPPTKRAISNRALIQRLNRLMPEGRRVMRSKPERRLPEKRYPDDVGRFFILEGDSHVVEHHLDIEALGRRLGALKPWETVLIDL